MNNFIFAIIACCAFASTAQASTSIVRELLLKGDVETLEKVVSELADQRDAPSVANYRDISDRLFRSSHPVYLDTLRQWLEEHPNSSAALSANTWAQINERALLGGLNGGKPQHTAYEQPWNEAYNTARTLVHRAIVADPRNVATLDAWLFLRSWTSQSDKIYQVSRTLMRQAPNRASVVLIIEATLSRGNKHEDKLVRICRAFAGIATDYDLTRCIAEGALKHNLSSDLRQQAARALSSVEDERLDVVRLPLALYGEKRETDPDILIPLHRSNLTRRSNIQRLQGQADLVARRTGKSDYAETFADELMERVADWLKDDPYNPAYRQRLARNLIDRGDALAAAPHWEAAMVHGWRNVSLWFIGAEIAFARGDQALAVALLEGAAQSAGADPGFLAYVHTLLSQEAERSGANAGEPIMCLRLRTARLASGYCQAYGASIGSTCDPNAPHMQSIQNDTANPKMCNEVASSDLSSLRFSETGLYELATSLAKKM